MNDAFTGLVQGVLRGSIAVSKQNSRNGDVLRIPGPVTITYYRPTERVLFNTVRDSNPFFHLFESLWMLAGRNDVAPLKFFVDTIDDFSDNGETFNGAYGYRWRHHAARYTEFPGAAQTDRYGHQGFDQLEHLIAHLKSNPDSRRAVLTMWNVEDDLSKVDNSLGQFSKDTACNLSVVFEINQTTVPPQLEMTVFNRSNDMIWGMFGANVVHFSFLQEYMAARLGVEVGHYHQISTNLHIYTQRWLGKSYLESENMRSPDYRQPKKLIPLVQNVEVFDVENKLFIDNFLGLYTEPFLATVAQPMCRAYNYHKTTRDYGNAFKEMELVASEDWKIAGITWLKKREANWKLKQLKQDKENGKETTGS